VLLETLLIGGARYTSKEALDRFLEKLNAGSAGSPVRSAPNQPTASRQAQIHASRRKLHSQRIGN
jgi:hypothetical protein